MSYYTVFNVSADICDGTPSTNRPYMILAIDWDVKNQTNQPSSSYF